MENNFRGAISSELANRYMNSDQIKKILHIDANYPYRWALSQSLLNDENKFDAMGKLEDILIILIDCVICSFIESILPSRDKMKEKTKKILFSLRKS